MINDKDHYQSVANAVRLELDSRSPRLRLSVIGYLTAADITPETMDGNDDRWLELVKAVVDYIGEEIDNFVEVIENLPAIEPSVPEKDDSVLGIPKNNPYL